MRLWAYQVGVIVLALGFTTLIFSRDRATLARLDRVILDQEGQISFCRSIRNSPPGPPPGSPDVRPGGWWMTLSPIKAYETDQRDIRTWDDERAVLDSAIAHHREVIREAERRQAVIRRRWFHLL